MEVLKDLISIIISQEYHRSKVTLPEKASFGSEIWALTFLHRAVASIQVPVLSPPRPWVLSPEPSLSTSPALLKNNFHSETVLHVCKLCRSPVLGALLPQPPRDARVSFRAQSCWRGCSRMCVSEKCSPQTMFPNRFCAALTALCLRA